MHLLLCIVSVLLQKIVQLDLIGLKNYFTFLRNDFEVNNHLFFCLFVCFFALSQFIPGCQLCARLKILRFHTDKNCLTNKCHYKIYFAWLGCMDFSMQGKNTAINNQYNLFSGCFQVLVNSVMVCLSLQMLRKLSLFFHWLFDFLLRNW